ncbi:MAG: F0F1 ATP synthase subunit A [Chloroflexi bacterium]|nr:F0F1 ATP synthase subunit A [Chloroflexota bacterium]
MNRWLVIAAILGLLVAGFFFRGPMEEIHIPAGKIASVAGFPITNTILATWVTILVLTGIFYKATSGFSYERMSLVPRGLQNLVEFLVEALLNFVTGVAGQENGRRFFPLIATIFLFVLGNAWLGLLPGYLSLGVIQAPEHGEAAHHFEELTTIGGLRIGYVPFISGAEEAHAAATTVTGASQATMAPAAEEEAASGIAGVFVPLLRAANTDLNTTLALALVAMFFVEKWGLQALGMAYLGKFLNFSGPIAFFVGLLELVSEFARVISFTFRLFGNMFAGEVLLGVITFLVPWVAVLPFFGLELFVGFVQALVFAGLTLVFGVMAVSGHGEEHHEAHPVPETAHH